MTTTLHRVLVLDSGLGGLSVLRDIIRLQPLHCSYLADNHFLPYGNKTAQQLQQRLQDLLHPLLQNGAFDAVVIACNTASTVALAHLRTAFGIPFVGVVPAIKTAAERTTNGRIGLLATAATVNGTYAQQLADSFASHCQLFKLAAPQLVQMAEGKLQGEAVDISELHQLVAPLLESGIDTGILGCTHFPWLREELQRIAPQVQWLDSGAAVARRLQSLLAETSPATRTTATPCFYHTGPAYQSTLTPLLQALNLRQSVSLESPVNGVTRADTAVKGCAAG
ncbi:glutamate racemase [Pseudomaricurvus sp. HS19]|uniref:glutamate racemase n=1 Tax=Pseudomaricurvus sp. HS19 TaxID=2692626 RepID=UPI001370E243|nr:glutamate racemase [Pseudomaricurvus sp. HS19]MYM61963.1 glutamate racemase [Pseudomaricurvus sp. HS19]